MKSFFITFLAIICLTFISGLTYWFYQTSSQPVATPLSEVVSQPKEKPLDPYTFDRLSQTPIIPSAITLEEVLGEEDDYTAHLFSFQVDGKKVTGQINLPHDYQDKKYPIILMLRGWADPALYFTGLGTKPSASVYASNGYITIAPDFLGYGGSDDPDPDTYAARVKKPLTILTLLESIKQLDYIDPQNIFIWGHSNGGQIAISILEITGDPYPTTLWAPVTKPFPYSILYYTDEYDDFGKALRKTLANFEEDYDVDKYSIHSYIDQITAPIQLHQGGADDAIPLEWSTEFVNKLKEIEDEEGEPKLDITYFTYLLADHNMKPNWDTVVARDLTFFANNSKKSTP